ncbi:MAG: DUF362 domain-containing protein [Ignavibacteriales bacterium]|nr:MAG: DUF362 domain-containing protein [Ignavibacteriales bacterium]
MKCFIQGKLTVILLSVVFIINAYAQKNDKQDSTETASGTDNSKKSVVYFSRDINPAALIKLYNTLNRKLPGKVAVKISTGEPGGHNFLSPDLIKDLVQSVNGTIVECNTAYPGKRSNTSDHKKAAEDHGFTAIAPVDIMDEEGSISLPFEKGINIKEDFVGSHFKNYNSFIILSHFKGHAMGGFGGAIKNMSIGIASASGKMWIHTAGVTDKTSELAKAFTTDQNKFLESMAEAAGAIMNSLGENIVYINVMNRLSVDCDCDSNPKDPTMADVGILASLDPIALDQACVDLVYKAHDGHDLIKRMEEKNGIHTLEHAEKMDLGNRKYDLVNID